MRRPAALLVLLLPILVFAACPSEPVEDDCGGCGDGQSCVGGHCVSAEPCSPKIDCDGSCADLATDRDHCGACGAACEPGVSCTGGACCPTELPDVCGAACVSLASDVDHCGWCTNVCEPGKECNDGVCCDPGGVLCDGVCRVLATDPDGCGACGTRCTLGAECLDGSCQPCPDGTTAQHCGGQEICLAGADCMVEVSAGTFTMGTDEGSGPSSPAHLVSLSAYLIDALEVTQEEYQACLDAGDCTAIELLTTERAPHEPVAWLDWTQADAYCRSRGKRLPTEAEWEKAARGDDERKYPWGDEKPDCSRAVYYACGSERHDVGLRARGASPYGVLDLAGNVKEWVADWYLVSEYERGPVADPPGPETGTRRVRRGGSFDDGEDKIGSLLRDDARAPDEFDSHTGFRCAKTP